MEGGGYGRRRFASLGVRVIVECCGGRERLRVSAGVGLEGACVGLVPWENSVMGLPWWWNGEQGLGHDDHDELIVPVE